MYEELKEQIKEHEGFVPRTYKDSLGKRTIGFGHLVLDHEQFEEDKEYTKEQLELVFEKDFEMSLNDANKILEGKPVNHIARECVIELVFNIGMPRTKKFVKMLSALDREDYGEAAFQIMDSLYARQVPNRANAIATKMRSAKT
jgi:lysozyme